jgi:uncharacterized protein YjiS (DUF1127 family)
MDAPYDFTNGRIEPVSFQFFSTAWSRTGACLAAWMAARMEISAVTWRLESLGERELADIGVTRADIPAVARGHLRRS